MVKEKTKQKVRGIESLRKEARERHQRQYRTKKSKNAQHRDKERAVVS